MVQVLDALWRDQPEAGPPINVPPRPASVDAAVGAGVYAAYCAACHGDQGRGDGPLAGALPTRPANLAAGELKAGAEPEQLYLRVAAGIPPLMPSFRATLSADSIWAVVGHVEAEFLRRR